MASGMSAPIVSRTGLPFSQLSATASCCRLASIASATALSTAARSAGERRAQSSFAACAASSAASTSSGPESAISQITPPVTGVGSAR